MSATLRQPIASSLSSAPYPMTCTGCERPLDSSVLQNREEITCDFCASDLRVTTFPAMFRPPQRPKSEAHLLMDADSTCFYHADRVAVLHCESCGRFLCELCDVEFGPSHLCTSCVQAGRVTPQAEVQRVQRSVRYDDLALKLGIYSVIIPFLGMPLAMISILMSIIYWKRRCSLVQKSRPRFVAALCFSLLSLGLYGGSMILFFIEAFARGI